MKGLLSLLVGAALLCAASASADVYPKFECYSIIDANNYTLWFSVDNPHDMEVAPSVNIFEPSRFIPPSIFPPGFTPRVMSITIDPNHDNAVVWILDAQILQINTTALSSERLCSLGQRGAQGDPGPQGPEGPPGPAGTSFSHVLASCHIVSNTIVHTRGMGPQTIATVTCGADEFALNGGGRCDRGKLMSNGPVSVDSWQAICGRTRATTATALCCPK